MNVIDYNPGPTRPGSARANSTAAGATPPTDPAPATEGDEAMDTATQPASEGRIVHVYVRDLGHCQAAVVVRAWGDGTGGLNLQVFRDGSNDGDGATDRAAPTRWATSVPHDETDDRSSFAQSWHWPERV